MTKILRLPQNWPVDVNYLEAEAFCNYKSKKLGLNITLPTEEMYICLRKNCGIKNEVNVTANVNFEHLALLFLLTNSNIMVFTML